MEREGLPIGLTLGSKSGISCNVLGGTNIVEQNVSCHADPWTVMVRNQGTADTTLDFQHAGPLLV